MTKCMDMVSQYSIAYKCECGALVKYQVGVLEVIGLSPACVVLFSTVQQAWRVKRKIRPVRFFRKTLRHICVTGSIQ